MAIDYAHLDLQPLAPEALNRRRFERRDVALRALVHCHGRFQSVMIRNVSSGGMKIEGAFGLMPGDTIRLELLTGRTFEAKVVWSVHPYCGIVFPQQLEATDPLLQGRALRVV